MKRLRTPIENLDNFLKNSQLAVFKIVINYCENIGKSSDSNF